MFVEHSIRLLYSVKCGLNAVGPVGGKRSLRWRVIDVSLIADAGMWYVASPSMEIESYPPPFGGVAER